MFGILLIWILPILSYFGGICLRYYVFAEPSDWPFRHQMALGLFGALVVVVPMSGMLQAALDSMDSSAASFASYLITIGIIVEHGMVMQETVRKRLMKARQGP